jgi:uncharacterized protein YndB with AHSA1/START domain
MRKKVFLGCGCGFLLVTIVLMGAAFLTIGMNDAEKRNISRTGLFSKPSELVWTPWAPNDGIAVQFPGYRPDRPRPFLAEVRRGHASGLFFDFTVYEGRTVRGDPASTVPAIASDWGAYYHAGWVFAAMSAAVLFFLLAFYAKD